MPSLLIGCGNDRAKKVFFEKTPSWTEELVTIDMNPDCNPTHQIDMRIYCCNMPFGDDLFDEIGAYDVLEHWGKQGDWQGWFTEMGEYHRILKPGGSFGIIVPIGEDAIADPGHTRFIHRNHFMFLNQKWYEQQLAEEKQVTDYRWFWKKNFEIVSMQQLDNHHLAVMMVKA